MVYLGNYNYSYTPFKFQHRISIEAGVCAYESKDPFTEEEDSFGGNTLNATYERNSLSSDRKNDLWYRINLGTIVAGREEYYYTHSLREKLTAFYSNNDLSYKTKIANNFFAGLLGGYTYQHAKHIGYYEYTADTNGDSLPDKLYYTDSDYIHSINENIIRGGIDIDTNIFNLKLYYNKNLTNNKYSGPGIELKIHYFNPVNFYGKLWTKNKFEDKDEFITNGDIGINILFFTLGARTRLFGHEKIPRSNELFYIGGTIDFN